MAEMPKLSTRNADHGAESQTAEVLFDDVPRVGVICDAGSDGDPTLVLWDERGDAVVSVPLAAWLAGTVDIEGPGDAFAAALRAPHG